MSSIDRYDLHKNGPDRSGNIDRDRKRSRSRNKPPSRSTIDNRPPWNNDTYIEGYEDVDEHGKFRKRGGGMPKGNTDRQQEELTKNWTETLREQHHQQQK